MKAEHVQVTMRSLCLLQTGICGMTNKRICYAYRKHQIVVIIAANYCGTVDLCGTKFSARLPEWTSCVREFPSVVAEIERIERTFGLSLLTIDVGQCVVVVHHCASGPESLFTPCLQ